MSCYPEAWESLWRSFDGTRLERVKVDKAALAILVDCTERAAPAGLVILRGNRLATCDRAILFALLNRHGREPCKCLTAKATA